jgi:hypothetical protein
MQGKIADFNGLPASPLAKGAMRTLTELRQLAGRLCLLARVLCLDAALFCQQRHGTHQVLYAHNADVVLMEADGGRGNGEVVEQFLRLAGIFAGDAVGLLEDIKGTEGDVAEIADGGGDEIEVGGQFFWHS